ncbi:MAG: HAD family hydrolase [Lachnospiraceae bacterium]|jgi:Cof subfamily protein (haloacid dehalogenase superfamily)|nr:HAD family hydrolase [Lachnospiraceae bacterium]MCI8994385.1 HAD family hydrolase [Lachnospiraceae bacterium]MCI9133126.1 HAD family hydrolase [Lachnospiraceae bacterium]
MKNIRLIACDLDGTLLLNGAQSLNPETCGLIQQLLDQGILFFAASGRQYTNLQRLFWPIRDRIGYLCENGCVSFYQGRQLSKECMDRELCLEVMQAIQETGEAEVLLSGVMECYVQPKNMRFYEHMKYVVKNDVTMVPDILQTQEEYMKVSIYEEGGVKDESYWKERFGSRCTVVTGGNSWLDMMPLHVNKGAALERVLEELHISREECMAIGDNDNDREMLELAGFSVAVRSARPEIRALARYETDTVENLLWEILNGMWTGL